MAVDNNYIPSDALGNGITTAFTFQYPFFRPLDLTVTLYTVATDTTLYPSLNGSSTYDYTVSGAQDGNTGEYLGGGTVTFNTAPPTGMSVIIQRFVDARQGVSLTQNGPFPSKTIEAALDRAIMLIQQLLVAQAICISQPITDPQLGLVLPSAAARAGNLLGFDSSGNVIVGQTSGTLISAALIPFVQASTLASAAGILAASGADVGAFLSRATGGTSLVSLAARAGIALSLKDFGAVADGATDNRTAIQAALDYGAPFFVPVGIYLISGGLSVTKTVNMTGFGAGIGPGGATADGGSVIASTASFRSGDLLSITVGTGCIIRDMQFNAVTSSGARTAGAAIHISGPNPEVNANSRIENVAFLNQYDCIHMTGCGTAAVENCTFDAWINTAYALDSFGSIETAGGNVSGCFFFGNNVTTGGTVQQAAVYLRGGYTIVHHNWFVGAAVAILVNAGTGVANATVLIHHNVIEEQTTKGVLFNYDTETEVSFAVDDNEFSVISESAAFQAHVSVNAGAAQWIKNGTISRNKMNSYLTGGGSAFINVQDGQNVKIDGNTLNNNSAGSSTIAIVGGTNLATPAGVMENAILGFGTRKYLFSSVFPVVNDTINAMTVAELGGWGNGSHVFVTDGHATNYAGGNLTVTGSGNGCHAFLSNGAWLTFVP